MATIGKLLEIIGLFCRISSLLQGPFAKETYDFQEPTNRSHPIRTFGIHSSLMMMIAFITFKSSLVPLFEGL